MQISYNTLIAIAVILVTVTISLQGERIDRLTKAVGDLQGEVFELRLKIASK